MMNWILKYQSRMWQLLLSDKINFYPYSINKTNSEFMILEEHIVDQLMISFSKPHITLILPKWPSISIKLFTMLLTRVERYSS